MARGKKKRRTPSLSEQEAGAPPAAPKEVEPRRAAPKDTESRRAAPKDTEPRPAAPTRREGSKRRLPKPKGWLGEASGLLVIVALALFLALGIQAWVAKPFQVPSGSMEPTLEVGDRIIANRMSYKLGEPSIGDIAVFHPPAGIDTSSCGVEKSVSEPCPMPTPDRSGQYYVKRVVAGPGDTIAIKDGHPVVNGVEKTDEPYIRPCGVDMRCNMPTPITVPPDHYFMMGDNRGESSDSRIWGPVPRDWMVGKAILTYWPPNKLGGL